MSRCMVCYVQEAWTMTLGRQTRVEVRAVLGGA